MKSFCFRLLALIMSVVAVPAAVLAADAVPAKQLFGKQNPGMDNFGVRLNLKL